MSIFPHLLIIAGYAVLAAVIAITLPTSLRGIETTTGYVIGGCVFLIAALLHEIVSRHRQSRNLSETMREAWSSQAIDVDALHRVNKELIGELAETRSEIGMLRERIERSTGDTGQTVISEMRVLQAQLNQLAQARGKPAIALTPTKATPRINGAKVVASEDEGDGAILDVIRSALKDNRIDLYLQPIVSLPQRKIRFHEAFSRLRTPSGQVIMPDDYLQVAREAGLISTIDNLLLFRCVQLARRIKRRNRGGQIFINLSSHTLADDDFIDEFVRYLEGHADLANHLVFEVSQEDLLDYGDRMQVCLDRLAELGFRISVDQLQHLAIDFDALARSHVKFVKVSSDLLLSDGRAANATLHPADFKEALRRNEIDLVADRIEDEREVVEFLDFELDFGQGFLFGEPRPAREN